VTGRSRRIVRKDEKLMIENRAGSADLAETAAFVDVEKRILTGDELPALHASELHPSFQPPQRWKPQA
jgi:hypothetical protein